MTVWVDDPKYKLGRMLMCHMISDNLEELHSMADKIGIDRKWLQNNKKNRLHYDICKSKRKLAVKYGAVEVDSRFIIEIINRNIKGE